VLTASPLLGPATWVPVADELSRRGQRVTVAACDGPVGTPQDVLDQLLRQVSDETEVVLVPHSNSGLYVAALAEQLPVVAVVFVDAGLPSPAEQTPTAPEGMVDDLAGLADQHGLLPPWTRWWPEPSVEALFPDAESRAAVERQQRRLPVDYFRSTVPTPPGWERLPAAYLAFADTYAPEREEARRRGWPVETLPGGHLHQLVAPAVVADAVERLLQEATGAARTTGTVD